MTQKAIRTIQNLQKKITPILKKNDVEFAGVFGSHARGEQKKTSDIDLLVKYRGPKGLFAHIGLEQELENILKKKVDLATPGNIGPHIRDNVYRDLKIIYGKRSALRKAYS